MEAGECSLQHQVARGGPIYLPDHIGPITMVPEFEDSVFEELKSLMTELCVDSAQISEDDLSVDELKIFTEEELVEKALKEALQVDEQNENQSEAPEESAIIVREDDSGGINGKTDVLEGSEKEGNTSVSDETLRESLVEKENGGNSEKADVSSRKKRKKREKASASDDSSKGCLVEESNGDDSAKLLISHRYKGKKRGRAFDRNTRAAELDSGYISKVQQLGKIKQKQDEDKAAARLHSFNGSCVVSEAVNPTSGPIEKMTSLRFTNLAPKVKPPDVQNYMPVSDQEIVLCVEIYHPRRTWVKTQEFLVLGRQTLTELRDRIYCLTDQLMQKAEQHDPSGYFLIEDVFCNDLRDPSAIDYSKPIFDWLRNSKDDALKKWEWIYSGELLKEQKKLLGNTRIPNLPHFKTIEMQKVRFYDLKFRLGGGYLYCHQGDCKHLFVIRDMRLIHPEDVQNRAAYPVVTFQLKTRFNKCSVCTLFRATKVTVDDKWAGKNPCYFCDNCYFLLHYNEDGTLLYDKFTVYDYHHDGD